MHAIKANHNGFVRLCLESGFKPVGRFGPCYLNLLATATNAENAEAVRAFLEHGADPDEPSHYGGQSSLVWCESNVESGEIMQVLRAARKLHAAEAV
jgi:ankyrin repeat protein